MHGVAAALGLLLPCVASAECPEATERWIKVSVPNSPDLRADRFLRNLKSDLAAREVEFCREDLAAPPLGVLTVSEDSPHIFRIALEVPGADAVERVVDVRAMPADGRTVTLALSACELLRSLWPGEVREDAAPEEPAPAIAPEPIVEQPAAAPGLAAFDAEVSARFDGFFAGLQLLGADARVVGWLRRPFGVAIHVGARGSLPLHGVDGTVQCRAFSGGADARWAFLAPESRVGLELSLGVDVVGLYVDGVAQGTATAHSAWLGAVTATLGLQFSVRLAHELWLTADVRALGVPRGVVITDGGQQIGGLSGFGVGGGIGLRRGL